MEKKASIEEKWTRLRWVTEFIDENKEKWKRWRRERERDTGENLESWDNKDREKKIKEIRERMNESEIDKYVVKYMDWRAEEKPRVAQPSPLEVDRNRIFLPGTRNLPGIRFPVLVPGFEIFFITC